MCEKKPNAGSMEILFWKLTYATSFSIILQILCLILFLLFANLSFLSPLNWLQLTISSLTSIRTWLLVVPLSCIIFTQGMLYSKDYVLETTYRKSRMAKFMSVFTMRNVCSFVTHLILSILTVWLYLTLLGGKYNRIYKSCKENYTCLVEETFFMFGNGIWIGFYYFVKEYLNNDRGILFPVIQQKKFLTIKLTIGSTLKQAVKEAFSPTVYFVVLYYFRGIRSRDWIIENLNLQLDDGDVHVFEVLRNNFLYAWLFSSLFIFSILCMKLLLKVFLTEQFTFPIESESNAALTLKEALVMSKLPIIQHLACFDFYQLSVWDLPRRQVLFSLSQPGGHPHFWNKVLEAVLKIISDYSTELNKATEAILVPGVAVKTKESLKEQPGKPSQNTIQENFFLKSPISSPGTIRNMSLSRFDAPDAGMIKQPEVPNIFERLWDNMANKLEQSVLILKKKSGIDYFFGELPENRLYFLLSRSQPVIWAMQGVSFIATASFTEDSYGVVQKDIPVIVTTLIQFKQNIDKLSKVNLATKKSSKNDCLKIQMRTALKTSVRRSLYNICNVFGRYLPQLPINKEVLLQLQSFIQYKEG